MDRTAEHDPSDALPSTGLSDAHLIALGEVAYWASRTEALLAQVIAAFLRPDDDLGNAVTDGMTLRNLIELGRKLVRSLEPSSQPRQLFESVAGPAPNAMEDRNHLLHGYWTGGGREPAVFTLVRYSGEKARTFTDQEVRLVAGALSDTSDRLFVLWLVLTGTSDYTTG